MNSRLRYSQKPDRFSLHLDGSEFPYVSGNKASMQLALEAMEIHGNKVLAALDAQAGKTLTDKELLYGLDHPETRTVQEQIAAEQKPQQHFDGNPYARALEMGLGAPNRKETKDEMYQRKSAEWEAARAQERQAAEFANDPKRVKAVQHANQELVGMKFDPDVTQAELDAAETRLQIALTGDLNEYRRLDTEYREARKLKISEAQAVVDAQIAALRQRRQEIESKTFDPPPAPAPIQQGQPFAKISADSPEWQHHQELRAKTVETFNL
jgi:hypothetical protein